MEETYFLAMGMKLGLTHRLRVFENRLLRRTFRAR